MNRNDESTEVLIRRIGADDPPVMAAAFASIGWSLSKPLRLFADYLQQHTDDRREVLVAVVGGEFAGYVTLTWKSRYQPFATNGVPEVQDLNVLPLFRRKGIATRLVAEAERVAFGRSPVVGIAVGLHPGYNAAQKMYVKCGYVPDGLGVTANDEFVREGQAVVMDDDLVLHLEKDLVATKRRGPQRVLFVCVENSNRSQMAEAFARIHGAGRVEAGSAGSRPVTTVSARAVEAMRECGYDLRTHRPKGLDEISTQPWDHIVTMGCGDECPWIPAAHRQDWALPDPHGLPPEEFYSVRDDIEGRVLHLLARLEAASPAATMILT